MRLLASVVAIVLFAICSASADSVPTNWLILPGKSIGPVYIGEDIADVMKDLGGSPEVTKYTDTVSIYSWKKEKNGDVEDVLVIFVVSGKVFTISAQVPGFVTSDGLGVGSKLEQWILVYGKPDHEWHFGKRIWNIGLVVVVDDSNKVIAVNVQAPIK